MAKHSIRSRIWNVCGALAIVALVYPHVASAQIEIIPGDSKKGSDLFRSKGCIACHTYRGEGGNIAPDLAQSATHTPIQLATALWNHAPRMWRAQEAQSRRPMLDSTEAADLLAYLVAMPETRSQAAAFWPGNAAQGNAFFERNCESCHSFGSRTRPGKVDLLRRPAPAGLGGYVATMWNHAPAMKARAGNQFPVFGPGDMSDLVAYLFSQRYFYEQGNVQRGARVFESRNCASCHEHRRTQTGAPDLTMIAERFSPITMSAAVWRHGPSMLDRLKSEKLDWPTLRPSEMSDLITYLNSRLVVRVAGPLSKK